MKFVFIGLGRMGILQARLARFLKHDTLAAIDVAPQARSFFAENFDAPVFDELEKAKEALLSADLVWLTVTDAQIESVASRLGGLLSANAVAVHTSGALSSRVLTKYLSCHTGSVHPLMACPLPTTPDAACAEAYRGIFHVVEGDHETQSLAKQYISSFGGRVATIDVDKKALYHAAAVFASNYPVTLVDTAQRLFAECGFSSDDARDATCRLLESALMLLRERGPVSALTGPVKRHDACTIDKHLDALVHYPEALTLYQALLESTKNLVGWK